ncbi:unnamed protein product [Oikopleura dioica]|uniref:Uncharacterized protein n=1 Tax=Oikopleura dioica TaxID=34765 RepID=E4WTA7_OIKDI|nr:unnamed protein product [Oikopleura dioica]
MGRHVVTFADLDQYLDELLAVSAGDLWPFPLLSPPRVESQLDVAAERLRISEEQVERNRGNQHGYQATSGANIPALKGSDRSAVFESVVYRRDPISGLNERRFDVGFQNDGLVASGMKTWRGKILAEFFIEYVLQPLRGLLCNSPSADLTMILGYQVIVLSHAMGCLFYPGLHSEHQVIMDQAFSQLVEPSMDRSERVYFITQLLDATKSMLQLVRCISTRAVFPRDLLESSHAYTEMKRCYSSLFPVGSSGSVASRSLLDSSPFFEDGKRAMRGHHHYLAGYCMHMVSQFRDLHYDHFLAVLPSESLRLLFGLRLITSKAQPCLNHDNPLQFYAMLEYLRQIYLHSIDPEKHPLPERVAFELKEKGSDGSDGVAVAGIKLPPTLSEIEERAAAARGSYRLRQRQERAASAGVGQSAHPQVHLVSRTSEGLSCVTLIPSPEVLKLSDVIAALNQPSPASGDTRKRVRSDTSSVHSVAPLSKALHWDGAPQRTRVMSTRSNRPESVAEEVEEPDSVLSGDDVFEPVCVADDVGMSPMPAVNSSDHPADVRGMRSAAVSGADPPLNANPSRSSPAATRVQPPRAARPAFFYDPSLIGSIRAPAVPGSASSNSSHPSSNGEPRGPPAPRPGPDPVIPSAAFNASNVRVHQSRHYGNQQNNPASGRRHATSGGPEMFNDSVSIVGFSGYPSRPRNVAYTPVNQRLWIRRCTRPSELVLKTTNISQGLIQSLRDVVARCPKLPTRQEGPQPDMAVLRQMLQDFHRDQLSVLPEGLVALFNGLDLLDGEAIAVFYTETLPNFVYAQQLRPNFLLNSSLYPTLALDLMNGVIDELPANSSLILEPGQTFDIAFEQLICVSGFVLYAFLYWVFIHLLSD